MLYADEPIKINPKLSSKIAYMKTYWPTPQQGNSAHIKDIVKDLSYNNSEGVGSLILISRPVVRLLSKKNDERGRDTTLENTQRPHVADVTYALENGIDLHLPTSSAQSSTTCALHTQYDEKWYWRTVV